MKVHILQADLGGSGAYRVQEPIRALAGIPDLTITCDINVDVEAQRFQNGKVEVTEVKLDADVLVVQRPLSQQISEVIRQARKQGMGIVVDLDDDFHNVHPDNIAAQAVDPNLNPLHNTMWLTRSCRLAHVVTVSTPALTKYASAPGARSAVIRNRIPARAMSIKSSPAVAGVIGWTGTVTTHPADMARARGALDTVDAPFSVVGDVTGVAASLGVQEDRVTLGSPWVDPIDVYWQAIADTFGIGIAPLEPSKFNKAKSWLKPAEYASLGIPFVVSPTDEYARIVGLSGAGHTATSPRRWQSALADLIDNREKYSRAAREWARANTLEAHVGEWHSAWIAAAEASKTERIVASD